MVRSSTALLLLVGAASVLLPESTAIVECPAGWSNAYSHAFSTVPPEVAPSPEVGITTSTGFNSVTFLGPYDSTVTAPFVLTLNNLPPHDQLMLSLDILGSGATSSGTSMEVVMDPGADILGGGGGQEIGFSRPGGIDCLSNCQSQPVSTKKTQSIYAFAGVETTDFTDIVIYQEDIWIIGGPNYEEAWLIEEQFPAYSHWSDGVTVSISPANIDSEQFYGIVGIGICTRPILECKTTDGQENWYEVTEIDVDDNFPTPIDILNNALRGDRLTDYDTLMVTEYAATRVDLPFAFPFFCEWRTHFWLSASNFISFVPGFVGHPATSSTTDFPPESFAWFWATMDGTEGEWYIWTRSDSVVVYGENLGSSGGGGSLSVGYVLHEDGTIDMAYLGSNSWTQFSDNGGSFLRGSYTDKILEISAGRPDEPEAPKMWRYTPNTIPEGPPPDEGDLDIGPVGWALIVVGGLALIGSAVGLVYVRNKQEKVNETTVSNVELPVRAGGVATPAGGANARRGSGGGSRSGNGRRPSKQRPSSPRKKGRRNGSPSKSRDAKKKDYTVRKISDMTSISTGVVSIQSENAPFFPSDDFALPIPKPSTS